MTVPASLDVRAKRAWAWAHALRRNALAETAIPLARHQIARQINDPHPAIRRLTRAALLGETPPPPSAA